MVSLIYVEGIGSRNDLRCCEQAEVLWFLPRKEESYEFKNFKV